MRLLLILALVLASLGFGPPAGAQAHHEAADHHSHAAHAEHPGGDDGSRSAGEPQPIVHVCPGCAFLGQPTPSGPAAVPAALPDLPGDPPSLQAFHASPIPPPPRAA